MSTKEERLEDEGLTLSRLLRYVATQRCTDQIHWSDARASLADCPDDEDKFIAYEELDRKQKACSCTPCTARRVMS